MPCVCNYGVAAAAEVLSSVFVCILCVFFSSTFTS